MGLPGEQVAYARIVASYLTLRHRFASYLARSALERRKILEQAFKTGGVARSSAAL